MNMTFKFTDKKAAFYQMIEDIVMTIGYKDQKADVKDTQRRYWEALQGIYSTLEYSDIKEIKQHVMFNNQWVPKVHELKTLGMARVKKDKTSPIRDAKIDAEILNYEEVTLEESRRVLYKILIMFYKKEGIVAFIKTFDLMFRGFMLKDFDFFANRLTMADKKLEPWDIISFFSWMRRNRVEPRLIAMRESNKDLWQFKKASDESIVKYKRIQQLFWDKKYPELELI